MMDTLDINDRLIRLGRHLDDERAALTDAIANAFQDSVDVIPSPPFTRRAPSDPLREQNGAALSDLGRITVESTDTLIRRPTKLRWLAAAAAGVLFVGSALYVVGQSTGTEVAVDSTFDAAGEVDGSPFGWSDASIGDVIVWIQGNADDEVIASINQKLAALRDVTEYRYISADEAYADFVASTLDDPALAASVSATDVGGYFRIVTANPQAIEAAVGGNASVTFVEVIGDRLYLLPPSDTRLGDQTFSHTDLEVGNVDEGSAIVVARKTGTGYDQIVGVAHLTSGSSFGEGSPEIINGIEVVVADSNPYIVGRDLGDGTWLEFYTGADRTVLDNVIAGTSVVDSTIRYQPSGGGPVEVGRFDDISGGHRTDIVSTNTDNREPDPSVYFNLPTAADDEGTPLLSPFAVSTEPITVRGHQGAVEYYAPTAAQPDRLGVIWRETTGMVAKLSMAGTLDETLNMAQRLRPVNASVWRAVNHARSKD